MNTHLQTIVTHTYTLAMYNFVIKFAFIAHMSKKRVNNAILYFIHN